MPGPVNIVLSTQSGMFSALIRWITKSPASHCLLTFYDVTLDKVLAMEATGKGYVVTPWKKWCKANHVLARYELAVDSALQVDALHLLADRLGDEYDTVSILGFLWRRWRKRAANPLSSGKKLICSEAVAIYLRSIGAPIDDPSGYTPQDVWDILVDTRYATLVATTN